MPFLRPWQPAQVFTVWLTPWDAVALAADVLRACQIARPPIKPLPLPPEFAARGGCLWVASGGSASFGRLMLLSATDEVLPLFRWRPRDPAKAAPADVAAYAEPREDGTSTLTVAMMTWFWIDDRAGASSLALVVADALARLKAALAQSGRLIEAGLVRDARRLPQECLLNHGTWTRVAFGASPSKRRGKRHNRKSARQPTPATGEKGQSNP
ncbi:MAG: hypothetical protein LBE08_11460 [Bifidobacteriaceae bacterium]|jgi:hypothetical protein|nr:hypothetical protein [Bifidobacteriaceae bacterium]